MSLNSFGGVLFSSRILTAATVLALAGTSQAALFSFASDDASNQFTFQGTAGSGTTFGATHTGNRVPVTLKIDDNNGVLPTISLNVGFVANFTLSYSSSIGTMNAQTHAYAASGSFAFVDATTGADLLTINLTSQVPAGMAIGGTMTQWHSAGGLFGSDNPGGGTVTYQTTAALFTLAQSQGVNLQNYGIFGGANSTSVGNDDFGFSLTFVNAATGGAVPINSTSRLPTAAWRAEGSFSGSATWVPSPGAAAVLGVAGLLMAGRRRR